MRAPGRILLLAVVLLAGACAPGGADRSVTEQGRTYTQWFYGREFDQLWARFSPEMKRTFPSPAELARFAGETVEELGAERGEVEEAVRHQERLSVYSRTASFEKAPEKMLVEWTFGADGMVTGFVVRPAADTAKAS